MYQNTFSVIVQQNAVELARQIEWDFLKMGYHVQGQRIFGAAERGIRYRAALNSGSDDTVMVQYLAGTILQSAQTANPRDFPLYRTEDGTTIKQDWGLVDFVISYFDSADGALSVPRFSADSTDKIKAIDVRFTIASPEPVIGTYGDSSWSMVTWQKRMYPRNLNQVNLVK
jgi:hypothetical protein